MQNKATGHQSINCHVDSCAYNDKQACTCTLSAIDVKPCCDCHDGKAENETNCSSYRAKSALTVFPKNEQGTRPNGRVPCLSLSE